MERQYNFAQIDEMGAIIPQKSHDSYGRWDKLPPDLYRVELEPMGLFSSTIKFIPQKEKDKLISFSSGVVTQVLKRVDKFLSEETVKGYREMQLCHKLAMILYGPPGTGKTCTAALAMQKLKEKYDAVCLDITGIGLKDGLFALEVVRKYQANPIVLFVDEIEADIMRNGHYYLPYLDGNKSVDGTILIGCTNFLNQIEDRIKFRKSRVKHLIEVKSLPKEVYEEYITSKMPSGTAKTLIDKFCFLAMEKNLTIDQLKNALIDYRIDKARIETAIKAAAKIDVNDTPTNFDEEEEDDNQ